MDNAALVSAYYDAWSAGDVDALDRLVAEDFVGHDPASGPDFDREGLKERLTMLHSVVPGFRLIVESVIAQDDLFAFRWRNEGTVREKRVSWTGITMYRVADGAIAELWHHWDNARLQEALGGAQDG
jgi:steroid delta-isomerase-like uncharacterized protein